MRLGFVSLERGFGGSGLQKLGFIIRLRDMSFEG